MHASANGDLKYNHAIQLMLTKFTPVYKIRMGIKIIFLFLSEIVSDDPDWNRLVFEILIFLFLDENML